MDDVAEDFSHLTVEALNGVDAELDKEIEAVRSKLQSLMDRQRAIKQTIYEKTPRDLSLAEVERMLGFKVNIVNKDKMWLF